MLRHQAAGNSVITSRAAKKVLFSSTDNCNCLILNSSKERHIFSEFKHGFCDKVENKKKMRKRVVKEAHFPFSHHKPKRMLKFLRNGVWIVIVQKIQKKGLSHSGKMHFSVSGHVTLGVARWRHELDYICPQWVLSKFGPIEAYMCRVIASWFFPSNGIKRYFNGPLISHSQCLSSTPLEWGESAECRLGLHATETWEDWDEFLQNLAYGGFARSTSVSQNIAVLLNQEQTVHWLNTTTLIFFPAN